jgi:hypothetical protein
VRDRILVAQAGVKVRAAALVGRPIVWAIDGFACWQSSVLRVFRDPHRTGKRGRPPLVVWAVVHSVQVVKRDRQARCVGWSGAGRMAARCAEVIRPASHVGLEHQRRLH